MSPMHFDRYTRDGCRCFYLIYEISRQNRTFSVNRDVLRYSEYSALQRSTFYFTYDLINKWQINADILKKKKKKIPFSVSLFFDDFIVLRLTMEFLILLRCCIKWEREIMRVNKYSLASSPNVWNFLTIKEHDLPENDPKNATGLRFPLYVSYDLDLKYKSVERALVMHRASFWCVVCISSKARQTRILLFKYQPHRVTVFSNAYIAVKITGNRIIVDLPIRL